MTGSAGCQEQHDGFGPQTDFSAYRSEDYGFTRMQVFNATHLYMEQVSVEKVSNFISYNIISWFIIRTNKNFKNGKILDSLWLIKDKHGSYKK